MDKMIQITITTSRGSTPRDAGTSMLVGPDWQEGTIGGGQLEYDAVHTARDMLLNGTATHEATYPLGPTLGQCCGGSVSLQWSLIAERPADPQKEPVWIYGAGHVGRAVAATLTSLYDVTLIDTTAERMAEVPGTTPLIAANPVLVVPHAPKNAHHLIMTYSHALDLDLCHALLNHRTASIGLIGSATKWARFRRRLHALGHGDAQISRITCPIGNPALGKHPQQIAVGVAAELISLSHSASQQKEIAS